LELAKKLLAMFGYADKEKEFLEFVADRPFNDCRYHIDSSKLYKLGWQPRVSFDEGLKRTSK
jgi:dTDP-D-glucose 4,6-dehydratase